MKVSQTSVENENQCLEGTSWRVAQLAAQREQIAFFVVKLKSNSDCEVERLPEFLNADTVFFAQHNVIQNVDSDRFANIS